MPRYYLDICDDQGLWKDEEGVELPDLESARKEATLTLGELARGVTSKLDVRGHVSVQIRTDGEPILTVSMDYDVKAGGCE